MLPDVNVELSDDQKAQLEEARKLIPKLREQIRKAKAAGLDMTVQEQELQQLEAQLSRLHAVYVRGSGGIA